MINATEKLSGFAEKLRYSDLDEATVLQTKMYVADYLAAVYAGYKINSRFNEAILSIVEGMDRGTGASVLVSGKKFSPEHAAYMNAVYAHGADMDDGNRKARGHVAAHVMSAVFALAETMDVTWQDVMVAINVGYEVYNRVAAAVQPDLVHRGFHSTGTAGAIACGAACAKLMGLDAKGIYDAMGISALQASGLIIIAESGQACKPLNPANAARTGIVSAKLAQKGVNGPINPLESQKGWFHAMGDHVDEGQVTDGLGERFTINESYLKPYPSCRHTHCGIEAGIAIRNRVIAEGRSVDDVDSVKVYIYEDAIRIAGQIVIPRNTDDAKFSIHYSLAVALMSGNYTLDDLEKPVSVESRALTHRIELIPDSSMEDTAAGIRGAKVEVQLKDGSRYSETVLLPKGDASNPFSWEDMRLKMEACMGGLLSKEEIDEIPGKIRNIYPDMPFVSICALINGK